MVIYSQNWLEKQLGAARRDGATPQDGRGSEEGGATLQVTWVDHVDGLMTKKIQLQNTRAGPLEIASHWMILGQTSRFFFFAQDIQIGWGLMIDIFVGERCRCLNSQLIGFHRSKGTNLFLVRKETRQNSNFRSLKSYVSTSPRKLWVTSTRHHNFWQRICGYLALSSWVAFFPPPFADARESLE